MPRYEPEVLKRIRRRPTLLRAVLTFLRVFCWVIVGNILLTTLIMAIIDPSISMLITLVVSIIGYSWAMSWITHWSDRLVARQHNRTKVNEIA